MISFEGHHEGPIVAVFTCGGAKIGTNEGKHPEKWVRNSTCPIPPFDPQ
jgi:hypothetical protein